MKRYLIAAALLALPLLFPRTVSAANWPHWRGPNYNGATSETNLPSQWSATEGVAWKTPLPGVSGATPIVWDDSVFVSSPDPQKNLNLICINRPDGAIRWQQTVGIGDRSQGRNNMASPSPVTDGHLVFAIFGTGDLAAFDFDGKQIWARNLGKEFGKFSIMWLYGSSPLLYHGKLYIQVLQSDPPTYSYSLDNKPRRDSYLLCIDPQTGRDLWRHNRPTDAPGESKEAYSSPIPFDWRGQPEILMLGGNYLTAHDAASGDEIWRCGGLNPTGRHDFRTVPSPVAAGDIVVACAPKGSPVFGIRAGGHGDVTDSRVAWSLKEHTSDWSTPLFYQGKLFVLDGERRFLTCLEPHSGKILWQGKLPAAETFWSSPTGADGKLYCLGERGTVVVLDSGGAFKVLSVVKLGEDPCRSSIVAAQGHLFIRCAEHLFCIGPSESPRASR